MAKCFCTSLLSISLLFHFHLLLLVRCEGRLAPALYVFGDSIVDAGNNNYLQTRAKANYKPYGINFSSGASGRFTNGKTIADFIARALGLPFSPPYLGLSNNEKRRIITGVSYASGSAGILPESGTALGENLNLDDQINYFQDTVTNDLPNFFKPKFELSIYLSKSIFLVVVGNNDYLNNYLQPANYNSSRIYTPEQFGQLLLDALKQRLTKLYRLGARKFIVADLAPVGCLPAVVSTINPKPKTPCAENINRLLTTFNSGLRGMILKLELGLLGSTFVQGDFYGIIHDMNRNPSKFGFSAGRAPCCAVGNIGLCLPYQTPCDDRKNHLYWDAVHPTQQVYSFIAKPSGLVSASLSNIVKQLAQKP